jgi:hypothetical protein
VARDYYVLCCPGPTGIAEVAFFNEGYDPDLGQLVSMVLYTDATVETKYERMEHLRRTEGLDLMIERKGAGELLSAMEQNMPNTVHLDGEKLAASVFKVMLHDELGISLKRPRLIKRDDPQA